MTTPISRCLFLLACLAPLPLFASDPIGIYARIDRVELEPKENPERIRITGVFSVSAQRRGMYYRMPERGVLYFQIDPEKGARCRAEWKDLASVAGTGECVGFGSRYRKTPVRVRAEGDRAKPDPYPLGWGVQRVRNVRSWPVVHLAYLPRCLPMAEPIEATSSRRGSQEVTLTAENAAAAPDGARYVFEIESEDGEIIGSPPIAPGEKTTSWTVRIELTPGEKLRWRVRLLSEKIDRAPVARATIQVKE